MAEEKNYVNLKSSAERALLGMISPEIRGIAVGFDDIKNPKLLKIICYLDRIPNGDDYQYLGEITGEMLGDFDVDKVEEICEYTLSPFVELNSLDSWVYIRKE